ncbi:MAG: cytochrome P450 [Gammaproteobacteria bacterium]|nr:cytochrome P450 [Gammaproteobacteria bacterium]
MFAFFNGLKQGKNSTMNLLEVPEEKTLLVEPPGKFGAAQLEGHFLFGNFLELFSEDGQGFHRLVMKLADKAAENEHGRCICYFGPVEVLFVTNPKDLQFLIGKKTMDGGHFADMVDKDITGIFELVFGEKAIFTTSIHTKTFQEARAEFVNVLKSPAALQGYLPTMWSLISKRVQEIESNNEPVKLYQTLNFIALDVIAETQLGFKEFDDVLKKELANKISEVMLEVTRPTTLLKSGIPFATRCPLNSCLFSRLTTLLNEAHALIEKLIKDNEKNILATDNFISRLIMKNHLPTDSITVTKDMIDLVSQVLVAGHETTTKLMFFAMLILANDKIHLEKIRAEISAFDEKPDREAFSKMHYLQAFMLEVLRLYPPIVHMLFQVKNAISFGKDTLQPGAIIIVSPFVTQQLDHVYLNAEQFDPTRFLDEEGHLLPNIVDPDNFAFNTFGFHMKKQCPGNLFARLEAAALIYYFVKHFHFTASHTVDPKTSYTQVAAMKLKEELEFDATMTFTKLTLDEEKRESATCRSRSN